MRGEYKKVPENIKKNANIKKVAARARLRTQQQSGKVQKMGAAAKVLFTVAWSRPFCMVTPFLGRLCLGIGKHVKFYYPTHSHTLELSYLIRKEIVNSSTPFSPQTSLLSWNCFTSTCKLLTSNSIQYISIG